MGTHEFLVVRATDRVLPMLGPYNLRKINVQNI